MPLGSLLFNEAGHLFQGYGGAVIKALDLLALVFLQKSDLLMAFRSLTPW